jgi:endonuclease YncB( thermonuclease family)
MARMRWIVLLSSLLFVGSAAAASELTGRASVIDGDTIEIRGERIRLHAIDAPESGQWCLDGVGKRYRCGQRAAFVLDDRIGAVEGGGKVGQWSGAAVGP